MTILLSILLMIMVQSTGEENSSAAQSPPVPAGMVWVDGGEFTMGGVGSEVRPDELPRHRVRLDGFFISETEVTNRQFKAFIDATGYQTVAERAVDWEEIRKQVPPGTPKPPDEVLQPGSLVFNETGKPVDPRDISQWWNWTIGANWRHPEGPASSIDERLEHPVVQVAWEDAVAFADWAGGALPTEAQWEYTARAGTRSPWWTGDERASLEGYANLADRGYVKKILGRPGAEDWDDGHTLHAPIGTFPANRFGLHDVAGNVWEWCLDFYGSYETVPLPGTGLREVSDPTTRVMRGGGWDNDALWQRSALRHKVPPEARWSGLGLRPVKNLSLEEGGTRDVQWPAPPDETVESIGSSVDQPS